MRSEESRKARVRLADDLYFAIKQDKDLCEEILDEYTYMSVSYTHLTLPTKA